MITKDEIIAKLVAGHISSPRLETDIILGHFAPNYPDISINEEREIKQAIERRLNHEPLDKIIGHREFYKSTFKVSKDVLSPRPETEILVEQALELIPINETYQILDLGTGSGCILLSLLKERPKALGLGVDISKKALAIAEENAQNLNILPQVEFINKSWTDKDFITEKFNMIVSNPPYIVQQEIESLDKEVKDFDPILALDGGLDGLKCYKEIAFFAKKLLEDNGYILLEVGYNQADDVIDIFTKQGLKFIKKEKDLAAINRCVILKKEVAK